MDLAMQIFDSIPEYRAQPNIVTFNTLINGFGRNKQIEQMMHTVERMKQNGTVH